MLVQSQLERVHGVLCTDDMDKAYFGCPWEASRGLKYLAPDLIGANATGNL